MTLQEAQQLMWIANTHHKLDAEKTAPTVFAEVAKFARVCAYDRPGTPVGEKPSRSDPVREPTTAEDAVADLHALLSAANEAGPYVLVGHSYGGLIVRLRASIPKMCPVSYSSTPSPRDFRMRRRLGSGRCSES